MKKKYRLKKNHEIAKIVKIRKRAISGSFTMYYKIANETKYAISVSKKFGCAVKRNYAKRVVRELLKKHLKNNYKIKTVIVVKEKFKEQTFKELQSELDWMFKVIQRKIKENKNVK